MNTYITDSLSNVSREKAKEYNDLLNEAIKGLHEVVGKISRETNSNPYLFMMATCDVIKKSYQERYEKCKNSGTAQELIKLMKKMGVSDEDIDEILNH